MRPNDADLVKAQITHKLLKRGGGGSTRTPDLGIMSPFSPYCKGGIASLLGFVFLPQTVNLLLVQQTEVDIQQAPQFGDGRWAVVNVDVNVAVVIDVPPPPLRTTSIDADCLPRASPPASSPAFSAANSLSASSPSVALKARPMASGTCGPTRMLPWADHVLPWRSPAQFGALGPV
jgi:hypothetical protein